MLEGGVWVHVAVGKTAAGLTVTETIVELPEPEALLTCPTYFAVVATVIGGPLAFLVGAVRVMGVLVGLIVESSVVSAPPAPWQQPAPSGSVGFQWTLTCVG